MGFAWKFLFPLSIVNLFVTATQVLIWKDATTAEMWIMSGINWVIALGALVLYSHMAGDKLTTRPPLPATPGSGMGAASEVR